MRRLLAPQRLGMMQLELLQLEKMQQGPLQPEQMLDQKRARELLDEVLGQMTLELRTVFVLYELEELSMTEIAATLRIPQGTVASRLRRARADFRDRVRALSGSTHAEVGS